jgi:hypothetical protein
MAAPGAQLPAAGDGLDPAEGLLDPLAEPLAEPVARVAGGASVDGVRRPVVFGATCGVNPRPLASATEPAVS